MDKHTKTNSKILGSPSSDRNDEAADKVLPAVEKTVLKVPMKSCLLGKRKERSNNVRFSPSVKVESYFPEILGKPFISQQKIIRITEFLQRMKRMENIRYQLIRENRVGRVFEVNGREGSKDFMKLNGLVKVKLCREYIRRRDRHIRKKLGLTVNPSTHQPSVDINEASSSKLGDRVKETVSTDGRINTATAVGTNDRHTAGSTDGPVNIGSAVGTNDRRTAGPTDGPVNTGSAVGTNGRRTAGSSDGAEGIAGSTDGTKCTARSTDETKSKGLPVNCKGTGPITKSIENTASADGADKTESAGAPESTAESSTDIGVAGSTLGTEGRPTGYIKGAEVIASTDSLPNHVGSSTGPTAEAGVRPTASGNIAELMKSTCGARGIESNIGSRATYVTGSTTEYKDEHDKDTDSSLRNWSPKSPPVAVPSSKQPGNVTVTTIASGPTEPVVDMTPSCTNRQTTEGRRKPQNIRSRLIRALFHPFRKIGRSCFRCVRSSGSYDISEF